MATFTTTTRRQTCVESVCHLCAYEDMRGGRKGGTWRRQGETPQSGWWREEQLPRDASPLPVSRDGHRLGFQSTEEAPWPTRTRALAYVQYARMHPGE